MRIGLFIPCYIDAFFPEVGIATLELLERFGHDVEYPRDQTCCGQPMANAGFNAECADTEALFVRNFSGFDCVVSPSGSCVHHVRDNFDAIEQTDEVKEVRERTGSRLLSPGELLCARAVPDGETHQLVGNAVKFAQGAEASFIDVLDGRDPLVIAAFVATMG